MQRSCYSSSAAETLEAQLLVVLAAPAADEADQLLADGNCQQARVGARLLSSIAACGG
jgi:hypothetical protein